MGPLSACRCLEQCRALWAAFLLHLCLRSTFTCLHIYHPVHQVASTYLEACKACKRSATALELYAALQHHGIECTPAGHAVGLWAYLYPDNCNTLTLEAALQLFEDQGELLASAHPGLAESTCLASLAAMRGRPRNSRPEPYAVLATAAQPGAAQAAREEQLYALLDLPARLVLASLSLAAKCEGGAAAAAALLLAVMQGLQNCSGSQALAFLELLPSWVEGLLPSQKDWNMALSCVLKDGHLTSPQGGQEPVARAVAAVASRLRADDSSWVLGLTAPALVRGGWTCTLHAMRLPLIKKVGLATPAVVLSRQDPLKRLPFFATPDCCAAGCRRPGGHQPSTGGCIWARV